MAAVNVILTSANAEKFSRNYLLAWVNKTLHADVEKIEDLRSGAAYCQMMDIIFPDVVPMRRVKFVATLEHHYINNFKILQATFEKLGVDKTMYIDKMVKGHFGSNFEFLQWFKMFYDANNRDNNSQTYDAVGVRKGMPLHSGPMLEQK